MRLRWCTVLSLAIAPCLLGDAAAAATYEVGPGHLPAIADVPWNTLEPGDVVRIHHRATPYREKWVIWRAGTAAQPIVVQGVPGPAGELPIIDGQDAVTPAGLNFWNEPRGVIRIGGANPPPGVANIPEPAHIVIENLEVRNGRPPHTFINDGGSVESYVNNCAAIYVEKAQHLTIRNCVLHDCGNGIFAGAHNGDTRDLLVEFCHLYGNGNVGSIFEHNNYTEAHGITFQFNRFGPLTPGAGGNNLKDRSAGLVVRYNWIEAGNRALDLVDGSDYGHLPEYRETWVYGNVLIENDDSGNNQILHYGGDGGDTSRYRKGTLHLVNNTVVSTRSGNTTLIRLSTADETVEVRNNIYYGTAQGSRFALTNDAGTVNLYDNWLPQGYRLSHNGVPSGNVNELGETHTGGSAMFLDLAGQDFRLDALSPARDAGAAPGVALPLEYLPHLQSQARPTVGALDLGAFEYAGPGTPVRSISLGELKLRFAP